MDDDVMRVIVGLPNTRFTYTGLLAGWRKGVECPEPGVDVADLMFDVQDCHWPSLPKCHVVGLDGASLCQTSWPPVVWLRLAGPVSDLSEVLVKGCEPAALDASVAPTCPAGPAPASVVASRRSWR